MRDASAAGSQLSVAGEAGPYIVNALVSRGAGGVSVELRTLDALEHPVSLAVRTASGDRAGSCGAGCTRIALRGSPATLSVDVSAGARAYRVRLPIRYQPGREGTAQRLLALVEGAQRKLRSVAIFETLGSGTGSPELTSYQVAMPDRFAYQLSHDGHLVSDTTIVGTHEWTRTAGGQLWEEGVYGGGGPPFSAGGYLGWWTPFVARPQLLDHSRTSVGERADVATVSRIPGLGTVWLRIGIDVTHRRVLSIGMITTAHFMTQTWGAFNAARPISAPPARLVGAGS